MFKLTMSGMVGADPATPVSLQSLSPTITLDFEQEYQAIWSGAQPIAATTLDPFVPDLGAVNRVRALAVKAVDGQSLVLVLSSAAGAAQRVPVSDLLVVRAQNAGDHFTAIAIEGEGRIEYLIGGDAE